MANYRVKWEIDIEAETPLNAARRAFDVQCDPESIATVFDVKGTEDPSPRNWERFDLLNLGLGQCARCSVCHEWCYGQTAHLHQGEWIGDECCWDERLRASE